MATEKQSLGVVTSYNIYHFTRVDPSLNVFAPPMKWKVRFLNALNKQNLSQMVETSV